MVKGKAEHKWITEEIEWVREYAEGISNIEITRLFNRHFRLNISVQCMKGMKSRYKISSGLTGHFPKGHIPVNKGSKGMFNVGGNMTSFKPGQNPNNTDPIGTVKMLADGYVWVKIDDQPKVPKGVNWKQKHRIIWEQVNGPIPDGYMIIFLNGDHEDFDIDNLAMVTKQENLIMNRKKLFRNDRELTKVGLQIAKTLCATYNAMKRKS